MKRTMTWVAAATLLVGGLQLARVARAQDAPPAAAEDPAEKRLLEVGKVSPDFTLPLIGGGDVTLSNLFKSHKAVIVAFWGIDAESGGPDLPKLQKLHAEVLPKGVATVAINPQDDAKDVERFVRRRMLDFQVCVDGKETNRAVTGVYKAKKLPTYYLLDPTGKVLWRGIGYKEPVLREELGKLGVK